jgi:hypothetical protein
VDAFLIKVLVLTVLAALFALTVWVTPWLFRSSPAPGGARDPSAPVPPRSPE